MSAGRSVQRSASRLGNTAQGQVSTHQTGREPLVVALCAAPNMVRNAKTLTLFT